MNTFLSKINNKIKHMRLYLKLRDRLIYYKGPTPLRVIVVGLPRSGTSFLTGLIVRMGYAPGPKDYLRAADRLNPYGYYENNQLMKIDHSLLKKFNGNAMNPPELPDNWVNSCKNEADEIVKTVRASGLQVYKGNMLIMLADLYDFLFPNVKWVFISRDPEDIINSLLNADKNNEHNREYYQNIVSKWAKAWNKTNVSNHSFNIRYEDFYVDPEKLIKDLAVFLNTEISKETMQDCLMFFKPNVK